MANATSVILARSRWIAQYCVPHNDEAGAFAFLAEAAGYVSPEEPGLLDDVLLYHVAPGARTVHELQDGDQTFEDKGVKIVVDRKSYLYLIGTELQFSGGLNGKGFQFYNPNANRTCGCGESFSL